MSGAENESRIDHAIYGNNSFQITLELTVNKKLFEYIAQLLEYSM